MNDISGTTTYTYDAFGDEAQIATFGLYSKTLVRQQDAFGRDLGHTMDGSRKNVIEYDAATGRIRREQLGGAWYTWEYLPGSDLKSSLSVGTAGRATWVYEPNRDLLTQVKNEAFGSIISQYDYTNDALGRRTAIARSGTMMSESRSDDYGYNTRSELISAAKNGVDEYVYQYDDIGNREISVEPESSFSYTANALNQYDAITSQSSQTSHTPQTFIPQYDDDGNQTLVKTKTGIWSVTYNGENRPVLWECGSTNIVMKFDRMGRRVEYVEMVVDSVGSTVVTNKHLRFVYDGYLCIQRLNGANNAVTDLFEWDPTEPIATRPLYWQHRTSSDNYSLFYTHDGNKNVSEVVFYQRARGVAAHYEYAPFGEVTAQVRQGGITAYDFDALNPWRFSSEYADDASATVYYNYRHYEPVSGRWLRRDPIGIRTAADLYGMSYNAPPWLYDRLGLWSSWGIDDHQDMIDNAFQGLDMGDCLKDEETRQRVIDYLKWANVGMDTSKKYNQTSDEQLPYHYNRGLTQNPRHARILYKENIKNFKEEIKRSLDSATKASCDLALKDIGKLSHMFQDYYGHGVSWWYKGGSDDGKIGRMNGGPSNPLMKPSSYGGSDTWDEHGAIWEPEPGSRAPDSDERRKMSVAATQDLLKSHLGEWCKKCGKCPPSKKNMFQRFPMESDYDKNF